jgi:hypothetical protein
MQRGVHTALVQCTAINQQPDHRQVSAWEKTVRFDLNETLADKKICMEIHFAKVPFVYLQL